MKLKKKSTAVLSAADTASIEPKCEEYGRYQLSSRFSKLIAGSEMTLDAEHRVLLRELAASILLHRGDVATGKPAGETAHQMCLACEAASPRKIRLCPRNCSQCWSTTSHAMTSRRAR